MRLRLLTWNLQHGVGTDDRLDLQRIAAEIAALRPDVAALQELDAYQSRSGWENQWRRLGRALGLPAFFGSNVSVVAAEPPADALPGHPGRWVAQYGVALLTRLPVLAVENHLLTYRAEGDGYKEQRGCLEVETPAATFLCTHFGLHPQERPAQARDVLALTAAAARPAVLLGDLNALPDSPEMGLLTRHFRDAGAEAGPTIPATGPQQRIDYCLLPPSWRVLEAHVLPTRASDHCPLLVEAEAPD